MLFVIALTIVIYYTQLAHLGTALSDFDHRFLCKLVDISEEHVTGDEVSDS
jgi:hypothetical protein